MTNEHIRSIRVTKIIILAQNLKSFFARKHIFLQFRVKKFIFFWILWQNDYFLDQISEIFKIKVKFCLTIISIHN